MDYSEIVTIEPGKRSGKPCIRGLRITVSDVLEYLASGMSKPRFSKTFPNSPVRTSGPASPSPRTVNGGFLREWHEGSLI